MYVCLFVMYLKMLKMYDCIFVFVCMFICVNVGAYVRKWFVHVCKSCAYVCMYAMLCYVCKRVIYVCMLRLCARNACKLCFAMCWYAVKCYVCMYCTYVLFVLYVCVI